jgi:hypothetical protein
MNPAKTPTQLRLTQDLLERADALIEVMAADPEVRALGMPTRTAVLRLAIARGLRDLERQYQRPTPAYASVPHRTTTPHDATPLPSREGTLSHGYAGRAAAGPHTPTTEGRPHVQQHHRRGSRGMRRLDGVEPLARLVHADQATAGSGDVPGDPRV